MRILVTGASGFVGGAIASHLLEAGHEVVGVSRRLNKRSRLLSRAVALDLGCLGAADQLAADQRSCDAIVHAAAATNRGPGAPEIVLTNCLGTQQTLELARTWQVVSFVYISSLSVIGLPMELPITEAHTLDPRIAYHASKLFGEHLVNIARREGLAASSLRVTAPVGPGMPAGRILSVFVERALAGEPLAVSGDGSRHQDYIDVRDVAAAVEAAIERRASQLLNLGSGRCISNLDLAHRCVQFLGSNSSVELSGMPDPEDGIKWEVSISRARNAIGFVPRHSLEDSITAVAHDRERVMNLD